MRWGAPPRRAAQQRGGRRVRQVEAPAQVNVRAQDEGLPDLAASVLPLRELPSALRTVLPEVEALAEPVVVVVGGLQRAAVQQHALAYGSVAPVVADDRSLVREAARRAEASSTDPRAVPYAFDPANRSLLPSRSSKFRDALRFTFGGERRAPHRRRPQVTTRRTLIRATLTVRTLPEDNQPWPSPTPSSS